MKCQNISLPPDSNQTYRATASVWIIISKTFLKGLWFKSSDFALFDSLTLLMAKFGFCKFLADFGEGINLFWDTNSLQGGPRISYHCNFPNKKRKKTCAINAICLHESISKHRWFFGCFLGKCIENGQQSADALLELRQCKNYSME